MLKTAENSGGALATEDRFVMGRRFTQSYFNGAVDEVRIESVTRSSNWIWACWMTMASNAAFSTYAYSPAYSGPPFVRTLAATEAQTTSATLNGSLDSAGGAPTAVWAYLGTAGATGGEGGTNKEQWLSAVLLGSDQPEGAQSATASPLLSDKTYYCRFYASNSYGEAWADGVSAFITGEVTVEATDAAAAERGADPGVFSIARPAGATNEVLTVFYTLGGTATNGTDYTALSGSALIPAGATQALVTVLPLDDHDQAPPVETVTLTLVSNLNYAVGASNAATVLLANNVAAHTGPFKMKIVFSGYNRGETLTDFPALVVFSNDMGETDFDFWRYPFLRADGYDLRFRDASGTVELPYEIEQWTNAGSAAGWVWVRVPSLAANSDFIWAEWANGFRGVWHMTEANVRDSTPNGNTGTAHGTVTTAAGKIGPAQNLDWATQSYVSLANNGSLNLTTTLTLSAWLNHAAWRVSDFWQFAYSAGTLSGDFNYNYGMKYGGPASAVWTTHGRAMLTDLSGPLAGPHLEQWHELVFVFDYGAGHGYLHFDGEPVSTNNATSLIAASQVFYIGAVTTQAPARCGRAPERIGPSQLYQDEA